MKIVIILLSLSLIFMSCDRDEVSIQDVLEKTVEDCISLKCIYFHHTGIKSDIELVNIGTYREQVIFSNKFHSIQVENPIDSIICNITKPFGKKIFNKSIEKIDLEGKLTLIETDTIDVIRYIERKERKGAAAIMFFIEPLVYNCGERKYLISGIKWQQNKTLLLYEIYSDSLKFIRTLE